MTREEFQALVVRLGSTVAHPVLGSVRYGRAGAVFATLDWPDAGWVVMRLSLATQARILVQSTACHAAEGARGRRGVTHVRMDRIDVAWMAELLADAWTEAGRGSNESARHPAGPDLSTCSHVL